MIQTIYCSSIPSFLVEKYTLLATKIYLSLRKLGIQAKRKLPYCSFANRTMLIRDLAQTEAYTNCPSKKLKQANGRIRIAKRQTLSKWSLKILNSSFERSIYNRYFVKQRAYKALFANRTMIIMFSVFKAYISKIFNFQLLTYQNEQLKTVVNSRFNYFVVRGDYCEY